VNEIINSSNTTPGTLPAIESGAPAETPGLSEGTGHAGFGYMRNPWTYVIGIPILMLSLLAVAFAFWTRPFYALSPGNVRETTSRVAVSDSDVYLPEGRLGFVTVSLTERVTMWEYLWAKMDDKIDLVEEELINGDGTAEEKRELDRRRMTDSKNDASVVALEYLGYEVPRVGLGVQVDGIIACMPAEGELIPGDLILNADGVPTEFRSDLVEILQSKNIGDTIELRIDRAIDNSIDLVELELGSSLNPCIDTGEGEPITEQRPMLGITLSPSDLVDYELPIDVTIDSDRVGGPSAGLAFTLAIVDVLTPGELTGGANVATTGTIRIDGSVGRVGGVKQKTFAALENNVELFIVPVDEAEEAMSFAGDDMRVVGVETLEQAIEALAELGGNGLEVAASADS